MTQLTKPLALILVLAISWSYGCNPPFARAKSPAYRELAKRLLRTWGKQAAEETVETVTRRLEKLALKHGDDVLPLIERGGFRALHTLEQVADDAVPKLVKLHARYGDQALWIIERPKSTAIFLRHGDDAARACLKHGEIVEPIVEKFGTPAARAMGELSERQARRLAILHESGDLAKIGQTEELLRVMTMKSEPGWADKVCDFIWDHKGTLAVTAALTAFLANPEPFIQGVADITQFTVGKAAEAAGKTVRDTAVEAARRTNWTLVIVVGLLLATALVAWRMYHRYRVTRRA